MHRIMDALANLLTEIEHSNANSIGEAMDEVAKHKRMPVMARSYMIDMLDVYRMKSEATKERTKS